MRYLNLARSCTGYNASITFWCLQVLSNCKSAMKIIIYTYLRVQIYRLFLYKCEPKKILPTRYTFFSVFVMTARAVRRISAYFFLQICSFFWSFRKLAKKSILKHFSCIFPYREVIGKIQPKPPLSATYMVKNMPLRCLKNTKFCFFWILLKK